MAEKKSGSPLRIPPQNLETEKALLGSIMLKPASLIEVADTVIPDSFYAEKHKIIFQAMLDLFQKKEPIDLLSLSTKLNEQKLLTQIGGRAYLTELVNIVPSAANVGHYADVVHRKRVLRDLIETAERIAQAGYDETEDLEVVLDNAEKNILGVTALGVKRSYINLRDTLEEAWDRLDKLHKSDGGLRGVPTGFKSLDDKLSGLQKSDLVILAARPSVGKTSLALDIARNAALQHKVPTCIFSLEMSSQQLVDRMLAAESKVDSWKIRTGKISNEGEFEQIQNAMSRLSEAPIFIDDQAGNTIMKMRSVARRVKSQHGLGLIVVDYLQLMMTAKQYDSLVTQVTEISRSLKALARELDVPVLALSQLSRAVEHRRDRPRLSDLRDSGSIEQDADLVMFIHRPDRYVENSDRPNIAEILIEKHRNGPTGKVELYFDDKQTSFVNLDQSEWSEGTMAAATDDF